MTSPQPDDARREPWIFLGSCLLLSVVVVIGLAREQRWGQPFTVFRLISRDATGLRAGQEVRISGIPVGSLQTLQLQRDARVAVQVRVAQRYAGLIGPHSVARQRQEGFVGDHYLEISPDPQPSGHGHSRTLRYEQPLALGPLLQQLVQTQTELQATLREARRSLDGVNSLSTTLQREAASSGPGLRDTLRQLSRTGNSAEQASTQAQQLLRSSQPALLDTLGDIQSLTRTSQRLLRSLMGLSGSDDPPSKPAQPSGVTSQR
ncbi:MAG: MlaD family protein [Vulcanococcus sp.]